MTTASAPFGTGAPVIIDTACRGPTLVGIFSTFSPALISPISSSEVGTVERSADRTAYPSRVDRGKGGRSRSAIIGAARRARQRPTDQQFPRQGSESETHVPQPLGEHLGSSGH